MEPKRREKKTQPLLPVLLGLFQKKNTLFVLGIAGILLIFLSDVMFPKQGEAEKTAAVQGAASADTDAYVQELEQRLSKLVASVEGAGECQVMITLESAGETVYAQDEKTDAQTQAGEDGMQMHQNAYENQHVVLDTDTGRQALVETQLSPAVQGVAVVCQGGADISVVARVTELVAVVFGLPTNRICVTKMI